MGQFQEKLTRCSMVCQDEVGEKYDLSGPNAERNRDAAQKALMNCLNGCVDKHVSLLKSIQSKLEKEIQSIPK
jgi:hypothetical protein